MSDREQLLASAAGDVVRDLRASAVTVFLKVPGVPELHAAAAALTAMGVGALERIALDDLSYASSRAWRSGRVEVGSNVEILAGNPNQTVFASFPLEAAAAPLFSPSRRFGTLTAFWQRAGVEATEPERQRLAAAAASLARDLDRLADHGLSLVPPGVPYVVAAEDPVAGGEGRASASIALIYHLHRLAMLLASAVHPQEVVERTVQRVVDGLWARAALFCLLDTDRLTVAGAQGCAGAFIRAINGSPLGQCGPEGEAMRLQQQLVYGPADLRTAGRLSEPLSGQDCFWVVLPLLAGHRAVGALSMAFGSERQDIIAGQGPLTALATAVGQAVERTRMDEVRHALADDLQHALLPPVLPQPAGVVSTSRYASATSGMDLGGDWYDLITLPENRLVMVIGDVQGHNTAAAVVMGELRSAVRAYAAEGHDPAVVLSRANQLLIGLDTGLFATCCCAWLDPDTGRAQLATAGHPPPLLRTADGRMPPVLAEAGIPLGIDLQATYTVTDLFLQPGTLLAFYTDGLGGVGGDVDPAAVRAAFDEPGNLESVGDRLIRGFSKSLPRHADDAALLLVGYEGPSADAQRNVRQLHIHRRDLHGAQRTRRLVREWLEGWELSTMADDEELLVSEVVTNGLVHGDSDVYVYVRRYPERIRVEVRDSDPHLAQAVTVPREEDQAEGGRGLVIVSALASAWGNSPSGRGKTVWFEIPTPDSRDTEV
ncbi:ATP-binding SpoIIE family protein phosphatase [Streptomyces sp. Ru62]|uniref:ATP-binding SpoIIE family protein phosphatase n=1 Tax=Streptomyces sp. Ru62 TaxID=2080745 RepID=UPI0011B0BE69|nr:ATP-binding SpoIIE family protein phosphatase [Streptomyces sp. Ru62]